MLSEHYRRIEIHSPFLEDKIALNGVNGIVFIKVQRTDDLIYIYVDEELMYEIPTTNIHFIEYSFVENDPDPSWDIEKYRDESNGQLPDCCKCMTIFLNGNIKENEIK